MKCTTCPRPFFHSFATTRIIPSSSSNNNNNSFYFANDKAHRSGLHVVEAAHSRWNVDFTEWPKLLRGGRCRHSTVVLADELMTVMHPSKRQQQDQQQAIAATTMNHNTIACLGGALDLEGTTDSVILLDYSKPHLRWRPGPSLLTAKECMVALYCNCHVYVMGGHYGDDVFDTIERIHWRDLVYWNHHNHKKEADDDDVVGNKNNNKKVWTRMQARLSEPRKGCTAVTIHDRFIVVMGGYNHKNVALASIDIIDTRAESGATSSHNMNINSSIQSSSSSPLLQIQQQEPQQPQTIVTVTPGPNMQIPRSYCRAAALEDQIWVTGGTENDFAVWNSVESLEFSNLLHDSSTSSSSSSSSALFVKGDADADMIERNQSSSPEPRSPKMSRVEDTTLLADPHPHHDHQRQQLSSASSSSHHHGDCSSLRNNNSQSIFPSPWHLSQKLSLAAGRRSHAVGRLGQCVAVAGGAERTFDYYANVEVIDPQRQVLWHLPDLAIPRTQCSIVRLPNHGLLVVGGIDCSGNELDSMEYLPCVELSLTSLQDYLQELNRKRQSLLYYMVQRASSMTNQYQQEHQQQQRSQHASGEEEEETNGDHHDSTTRRAATWRSTHNTASSSSGTSSSSTTTTTTSRSSEGLTPEEADIYQTRLDTTDIRHSQVSSLYHSLLYYYLSDRQGSVALLAHEGERNHTKYL